MSCIKMVNASPKKCGNWVVGERQEHLSQFYECHVVWKARVIVDDSSYVLAKSYEILPSGHVLKSNTVKSIQT